MKITELLTEDTVVLNLSATSKEDVIDELIETLDAGKYLSDKSRFKEAILARESQSTTGVGEGIAIPHAKTDAVRNPAIVFGRSTDGVDYDSLDGQPAHLFFMIAATEGASNEHLEALSKLSSYLMDESFRAKLESATTVEDVIKAVNEKEADQGNEEPVEQSSDIHLLAVTACPTGIAHTYMAADKLKDTAKKLGVNMKVETRGSGGAKNVLTSEEIENADVIIVAADTKVETNRFKGKRVIETSVGNAIHKTDHLIERAMKKDAPIYKGDGSGNGSNERTERRGFYKHLMNGVSHMLPFVVAGGILIAISFIFGINAFDPEHPSYHPFAEALMTIGGGNAFGLMVPILAGFIAMSIADKPGFTAGMVAGMLANSSDAGFLGGIIAGFLGGYIVVGLHYLLKGLPKWLEGIKAILFIPVLGVGLSGLIMLYVINEPVSAINTGLSHWLSSLNDANAVILGLLLGAMMAFDMGGPVNKAAYVFGTGLLASGVTAPMAAVMAAGMTPPLGIALAVVLYKKKFTSEERKAAPSTAAMGISFITEGAIPFAAADPLRVIPSIMVGSAVTGALSMAFNTTLQAPHGGFFVLFIPNAISNVLLYGLAIIVGTVVTAFLLGTFKKPIQNS
ncbi:PTS fructose transporter subunit IIABC [Salirhabdus salicampi]|uniref:PTS fructose transporter subunit IIABC n=1 Tax=Salirhabdus salicampi TaxID=476102 RepID=UPI0020C33468|nr:PTS fructose transporter subunit IIABC [Salirhabdus salicampi]MCP8617658.1 fructose-specific PTS transporter subunit EIIC [Salirhabdus salicampi]